MDAKRLTLSYDETEDRIRLDCADGSQAVRLLLTRRITRQLVRGFAETLATSSAVVARAPADMRREALVIEHMSAVMAPPADTPSGGPQKRPDEGGDRLAEGLVHRVDVEVTPTIFRLLFHSAAGVPVTLSPGRGDFHRLLASLAKLAGQAGWDLGGEADWLDNAESVALSPAGRSAS
jgi:hypothetical protein